MASNPQVDSSTVKQEEAQSHVIKEHRERQEITLEDLLEISDWVSQLVNSITQLTAKALDKKTVKLWKEYYKLSDQTPQGNLIALLLNTPQIKLATKLRKVYNEEPNNLLAQIVSFDLETDSFDKVLQDQSTAAGVMEISNKKLNLLRINDPKLLLCASFHPLLRKCFIPQFSHFSAEQSETFVEYEEENRKLHAVGYQFMSFISTYILTEKYPHIDNTQLALYQLSIFSSDYFAQIYLNFELHLSVASIMGSLKSNTFDVNTVLESKSSTFLLSEVFSEAQRKELYSECFLGYIGALVSESLSNTSHVKQWLSLLVSPRLDDIIYGRFKPVVHEPDTSGAHSLLVSQRTDFFKKQFESRNLKLEFKIKSNLIPFKVHMVIDNKIIAKDYGRSIGEAERKCVAGIFGNLKKVEQIVKLFNLNPFPGDDIRLQQSKKKKRKIRDGCSTLLDSSSTSNLEALHNELLGASLPDSLNEVFDLPATNPSTTATTEKSSPLFLHDTKVPSKTQTAYPHSKPGDDTSAFPITSQTSSNPFFNKAADVLSTYHPQNSNVLGPLPLIQSNLRSAYESPPHHQQWLGGFINTPENCPSIDIGAKNSLYAKCGSARLLPQYKFERVAGGMCLSRVYIKNILMGQGLDQNKKLASQRAAMMALANSWGLTSLGLTSK